MIRKLLLIPAVLALALVGTERADAYHGGWGYPAAPDAGGWGIQLYSPGVVYPPPLYSYSYVPYVYYGAPYVYAPPYYRYPAVGFVGGYYGGWGGWGHHHHGGWGRHHHR